MLMKSALLGVYQALMLPIEAEVGHKQYKCPTPHPHVPLSLPACHKGILQLEVQHILGLQQRLLEFCHLRLQLAYIPTGLHQST